jgi:hypothetical protein
VRLHFAVVSELPIDKQPGGSPGGVFAWGAFLACSWTWCIGMYLPVLLLRDFGPWGWIVFALPNIAGAAAMGWVLGSPQASLAVADRHRAAARWFSIVTVLFHIYFAGWMIQLMLGPIPAVAVPLLAGAWWWIGSSRMQRDPPAGVLVWVLSAIAFALMLIWLGDGRPPMPGPTFDQMPVGVLWLAPVCGFGFLLCPYLDLTFHRARQALPPAAGRTAFTLGFAVLFLVMILFTFWYAPWIDSAQAGEPIPAAAGWIIGLHLLIQSAYTVAIHLRELPPAPAAETGGLPRLLTGLPGAILLVLVTPYALRLMPPGGGETIYLYFMVFYGLVFPAYVWLCMIPTPGGHAGPGRARLGVLAVSVIVAAPMYYLGFVRGETFWLLPALAVVLLSRLFVSRPSDR